MFRYQIQLSHTQGSNVAKVDDTQNLNVQKNAYVRETMNRFYENMVVPNPLVDHDVPY